MNSVSMMTYFKRILAMIALVISVLVVQIPVEIIASSNAKGLSLIALGLLYIGGFVLFIWLAYLANQRIFKKSLQKLTKNDFKLAGKALLLFYVVEICLSTLNLLIYKESGTENNKEILSLLQSNPSVLVLMSITMVLFSPILEELVFRGFLIKGLVPRNKPFIAMVASGVLFSLGHASSNLISFMIYAALGMILAYLYLKTDKIEIPILLHFLNNLIATIIMVATLV